MLSPCQNLASYVLVGTPPRITRDTIDFSKCDVKHGDNSPIPFSFMSERVKVDVSKILFSDCHCVAQVCVVRFEQIWKKIRKQVFCSFVPQIVITHICSMFGVVRVQI